MGVNSPANTVVVMTMAKQVHKRVFRITNRQGKAKQTTVPSRLSNRPSSKVYKPTGVGKDVEAKLSFNAMFLVQKLG